MMAPIKLGATGWPAFALQSGIGVKADGAFGPITKAALETWQKNHDLTADAIAGPATQAQILKVSADEVDRLFTRVPHGLLDGFAAREGVNKLAAVNWSVAGGVDCGPVQRRVTGAPFVLDALKEAFDPHRAFLYAARIFTERIMNYAARNSSLSSREVIEAAVLAHNWPAGAEQLVRYGRILNPGTIATWTNIPVSLRGQYGSRSQYTYGEWSHVYPAGILEGVDY